MSVIEVDSLLQAVSEAQPCGEDLEYDPAYATLEAAAKEEPSRMIEGEESDVSAKAPDWRDVKRKSIELLGRSKDLRIVVYLTQALATTDGLLGMSDSLDVMKALLDRYWETLHPLACWGGRFGDGNHYSFKHKGIK